MKSRFFLMFFVLFLVVAFLTSGALAQEWPTRPINIIVFSAAGGSTDLSNRALAEAMKPYLGVDIVVQNMEGAMGGTATSYVWDAPHDGYLWFGLSEGFFGQCVLGIHPTTVEDWEFFWVGGTPGIISVRKDSPYQNFQELLDDIKERPGEITIATSIPGCIWHIQYLTFERYGGYDLEWIPYPGSRPSIVSAIAGEVDVVWTGLGEQAEFLKAGQLRPLAMYDTKSHEFAGVTVPPITDFVPELAEIMPLRQCVGFALPADTSPEILDKITGAFVEGMKEKPVLDFAENVYSELYGYYGKEAKDFARRSQSIFAWLLWEEGVAKESPDKFGIPKPEFLK